MAERSPAVVTEDLTKRFGAVVALDGLTLEVGRGEVFGFLGPNGAGKTTTVRLLLGLLHPTRGSARVFGLDVSAETVAVHQRIGYVPGELTLWPGLRGGEILHLLGMLHGSYDVTYRDELCERFDLDPTKRGRAYSKGNRQKVGLIAALMVRPDLLVLDEPTAGLDPLMEKTFRECVREAKERGQTVFLSSHILSEVEALCDRVGILRSGRLIEVGTLRQLRRLSARSVEVHFDGAVPDLAGVPGVSALSVEDQVARFQLRGPATPLIHALGPHGVTHFDSREPSLEELFLGYYGEEDGGTGARPTAVAATGRADR